MWILDILTGHLLLPIHPTFTHEEILFTIVILLLLLFIQDMSVLVPALSVLNVSNSLQFVATVVG
jgi:hypothetical protein